MKKTMVQAILCGALIALILSCASSGGGGGDTGPVLTWDWGVQGDESNGGTSTIAMTEGTEEGVPSYAFAGNITNDYEYGYAQAQMMPVGDTIDLLKGAAAMSFRFLGDGEAYAIKITTTDITDYAYCEYVFETKDGEPITVIVPMVYLLPPSWGAGVDYHAEYADHIEIQTTRNGSPGPFQFKIWDFRLHTSVPQEKDLKPAKGAAKATGTPAAAKGVGGDLGAFSFKVLDNFQYGNGYQGVFSDKRLMNGHKIVPGETFTLKITYSTSRDLEDDMLLGLVDTTAQAQYWRPLSFVDGAEDGSEDSMISIPKSAAGEVVSATITFKTVAGATGASGPANALVFSTNGEGQKGMGGSGKQKAVTLDITEFVFTQE